MKYFLSGLMLLTGVASPLVASQTGGYGFDERGTGHSPLKPVGHKKSGNLDAGHVLDQEGAQVSAPSAPNRLSSLRVRDPSARKTPVSKL